MSAATFTPAPGSVLAPSSAVSWATSVAGTVSDVVVLVGTQAGYGDLEVSPPIVPPVSSFTPAALPGGGSPVFISLVISTVEGPVYLAAAVYRTAAGDRAPGVVEMEAEVQYLIDQWRRSELAGYPQSLEVPDPGHGLDQLSPVIYRGQPFDATVAAHVAPFTPDQVFGYLDGGNWIPGTGYLDVCVKPLRPPQVITPGRNPETREDVVLEVNIVTPAKGGHGLAALYAGVLAMLFRRVSFRPGEAGIDIIRNLEPPPERATLIATDKVWRTDQLVIPLARFFRAGSAGAH